MPFTFDFSVLFMANTNMCKRIDPSCMNPKGEQEGVALSPLLALDLLTWVNDVLQKPCHLSKLKLRINS